MTALQKEEGIAARALEFVILTVARTGEVIGACWGEIDKADTMAGKRNGRYRHSPRRLWRSVASSRSARL